MYDRSMVKKSHNLVEPNGVPILIVHDWIEKNGGAEKVIDELMNLFPDAHLLTLWCEDPSRFNNRIVKQTFLKIFNFKLRKIIFLPFMPFIWRLQKTNRYSVKIVSTHLFAHHIKSSNSVKLLYVHTPARYLWEPDIDNRSNNFILRLFAIPLKFLDARRALEANLIASNSFFVKQRILDKWNIDANVIYPPVNSKEISEVENWSSQLSSEDLIIFNSLPNNFVVGASRLVGYKKIDEVLKFAEICKVAAVIIGSGPEMKNLKNLSLSMHSKVIFLGNVSNELMYACMQKAQCLVFPAVEDFGIIPVEAMAVGCPVIANNVGGTSETVIHGKTGFLIDFKSNAEIITSFEHCSSIVSNNCKIRANEFDKSIFASKFTNWIENNTELRENIWKNYELP